MTPEQFEIAKIFLPHAIREMTRLRENNIRFAHYTSAETGLKILREEKVLLRNSSLMNDFSEIRHGLECLRNAYSGDLGTRLKIVLKSVQSDLPEIFEHNFNNRLLKIQNETYIISLSAHGDTIEEQEHEDRFGRLSMWRAYAQKNGIAFILNNKAFVSESRAIDVYTSPVLYQTPEKFSTHFEEVVTLMEKNTNLLKALGGKYIDKILSETFKFSVQSIKHPSFREEKEWRIIYTPAFQDGNQSDSSTQKERIPMEILSLNGVPQRVFSIPLKNYPDEGFIGATIPELIDRILIGPSIDSGAIYEAFVSELRRHKVSSPEEKVIITGIPLRT